MRRLSNIIGIDKGALQLALNVLKRAGKEDVANELKTSCVELNQPQQEPSKYLVVSNTNRGDEITNYLSQAEAILRKGHHKRIVPLYTTPQIRLSDAEASSILATLGITPIVSPRTLIGAIENELNKEGGSDG